MEKFIIGEIKINREGKSKEELKAEAMKEIEKQLDDAFKDVKEPKKDEKEPAKLHIHIDEDSERNGYIRYDSLCYGNNCSRNISINCRNY